MNKTKLIELFNDLIDRVEKEAASVIYEHSIQVDTDIKILDEEIAEYKKLFEIALNDKDCERKAELSNRLFESKTPA